MAISAIKSNIKKIFFCKKIYHDVVTCVPNFQLSAKSSSFFCALFLHFYGILFLWTPHISLLLANIPQKIAKLILIINHISRSCSLFSSLRVLMVYSGFCTFCERQKLLRKTQRSFENITILQMLSCRSVCLLVYMNCS